MLKAIFAGLNAAIFSISATALAQSTLPGLPHTRGTQSSKLQIVHTFYHQMPVGISLTSNGRMFVSYPRWGDPLTFTLAEIRNGKEVPFPRAGDYQLGNKIDPQNNLVSLQGILVDPQDRLWVLDTGTVNMQPVRPFTPKIVCYNTRTGQEVLKYRVPADVAPEGAYLNDLRIDLTRGTAGIIYITDSGKKPGIIVFDIASRKAWRRLADHPSVKPEEKFVGFVEGRALFKRPKPGVVQHLDIGADSLAISSDGKTLYYAPLASRRLYSVSCDALADQAKSDADVAATVKDLGDKGVADGMEQDRAGGIYTTNWESHAILRRRPDGLFETIVYDERLLWPDTLFLTHDGYLYVISNQLHRQKTYNNGVDLRQKPYFLARIRLDRSPVVLWKGSERPTLRTVERMHP